MKKKNVMKVAPTRPTPVVRSERLTCLLSLEEKKMVDSYLRKYHITNRSRWMRETLLKFIMQNLEIDYPTLFDEHDMRR